jgi:hypothetical protein
MIYKEIVFDLVIKNIFSVWEIVSTKFRWKFLYEYFKVRQHKSDFYFENKWFIKFHIISSFQRKNKKMK